MDLKIKIAPYYGERIKLADNYLKSIAFELELKLETDLRKCIEKNRFKLTNVFSGAYKLEAGHMLVRQLEDVIKLEQVYRLRTRCYETVFEKLYTYTINIADIPFLEAQHGKE